MSWLLRWFISCFQEERNPDYRNDSADPLVTYLHSISPEASASSSSNKIQPPNLRLLMVQKMGVQEQIILHRPKSNPSSSSVRAPHSGPHSEEHKAKVRSPSPCFGSLHDQSVRKSPQKFTGKTSQDCHKVTSPVHEQSLYKLSELPEPIEKLQLRQPVVSPLPRTNFKVSPPVKISHERQTISPQLCKIEDGPLKPIKVSHGSHQTSGPLSLICSVHDQSGHVAPPKCPTSTLDKRESMETRANSAHGHSVNKLPELPEPIKGSQLEQPVDSPLAITKVLVESTKKPTKITNGPSLYGKLHEALHVSETIKHSKVNDLTVSSSSSINSVMVQSQKFPTPILDKRVPMENRANSAHGHSINKLPELPKPIKGSQLKEPVASPLAITKVWVESTKKSTKTSNDPSHSGKLQEALHVSETIKQSKVNDMTLSSSSSIKSVMVQSGDEIFIDEELSMLPQTVSRKKYKLPVYPIPEHLKDLIERDKVPEVLRKPLSPSTYTDYFAALLYAEDFYTEKWTDFLLLDVNIELHEEQSKKERGNNSMFHRSDVDKKLFVKFEIDSVPERRPYLLSRDYVFLQHSGDKSVTFEGSLVRVMKSTHVLAKFGEEFYSQYSPYDRYDVSFSFNRACLKRCHQAVASAMDLSFRHVLFPEDFFCDSSSFIAPCASFLHNDGSQDSVVHKITTAQGADPPYLISGPLSTDSPMIRKIIKKAVLQICRNLTSCRILVCAPKNRTCDELAASLTGELPDSELFRANAAFRDFGEVDGDVIPLCSYDGECFITPSHTELKKFRVVTSTFVSSFRLHSCGIPAGHFTHIFLVDASGATEPESMIPLANLVGEKTAIVVTGCVSNHPPRVRSDIARLNGLKRSYFHRLLASSLYWRSDSVFASHLN